MIDSYISLKDLEDEFLKFSPEEQWNIIESKLDEIEKQLRSDYKEIMDGFKTIGLLRDIIKMKNKK